MKRKAVSQGRMQLVCTVACMVMCSACTRTRFSAAGSVPEYPPYKGKVLVIAKEVPGAERIGSIQVSTNSIFQSNGMMVRHWKKEAARHGANVVRWDGEGCGDLISCFTIAVAYRVPDVNDPKLKEYLPQPHERYQN